MKVGDYKIKNIKFKGASSDRPSARSGSLLVTSSNQVFVIGGQDKQKTYNDIHRLSMADFKFRKLTEQIMVTEGQINGHAAYHDKTIYFCGGQDKHMNPGTRLNLINTKSMSFESMMNFKTNGLFKMIKHDGKDQIVFNDQEGIQLLHIGKSTVTKLSTVSSLSYLTLFVHDDRVYMLVSGRGEVRQKVMKVNSNTGCNQMEQDLENDLNQFKNINYNGMNCNQLFKKYNQQYFHDKNNEPGYFYVLN